MVLLPMPPETSEEGQDEDKGAAVIARRKSFLC